MKVPALRPIAFLVVTLLMVTLSVNGMTIQDTTGTPAGSAVTGFGGETNGNGGNSATVSDGESSDGNSNNNNMGNTENSVTGSDRESSDGNTNDNNNNNNDNNGYTENSVTGSDGESSDGNSNNENGNTENSVTGSDGESSDGNTDNNDHTEGPIGMNQNTTVNGTDFVFPFTEPVCKAKCSEFGLQGCCQFSLWPWSDCGWFKMCACYFMDFSSIMPGSNSTENK